MSEEYVALALILSWALYLFWTGILRTDITALLVMFGLIIPWPHRDGVWRGILNYQEGFSGFDSAAVMMVAAMFIFVYLWRGDRAHRIGGLSRRQALQSLCAPYIFGLRPNVNKVLGGFQGKWYPLLRHEGEAQRAQGIGNASQAAESRVGSTGKAVVRPRASLAPHFFRQWPIPMSYCEAASSVWLTP